MAFGGTIKLTGEKEYKQALQNINTSLREMSSQMSVVTSSYNNSDKSISALTQKNQQLNSILQKQKSDYESLKATYDKMASVVNQQKSAHDKLQAEYDEEKAKLETLKNTLGTSSKEYQNQEKNVNELAKKLDQSNTSIQQNENALSKMRTSLNSSATAINKTEAELNGLNDELSSTNKFTEKAGEGFTVFKGIVSNLATKAITIAVDGLKKLGSAVFNVGKQAVESYAEYEQLVGGVETLFKDSAKEVEKYANNAYKTAGLSANKYMETVTSFSASLLQGLNGDTAKTAKIADMAITDMADNANKMGTSMEMIQNAYQGFAKQNYTMLDNLKLGYGGTKTEMLRLVNDSKVLNKTVESLDEVTFDQIILAIHKVQENIGITGTTAQEAEHTISGSIASMKSSWQNLLTGMANSEVDTKTLVSKFVESVKKVVKNVVPVVKQSIKGLVEVAEELLNELYGSKKFNFDSTKVVQTFEKAIKKAIDTISWFIKNKDNFITAMKLMLAAFVVTKINSWSKALNNGILAITKAITQIKLNTIATNADTASQTAHTTAQIAGKTATEVLTAKQATLNAVMSANPIGLVITAVSALISVFAILKSKTDEQTNAQTEQSKALEEAAQKAEEANKAYDDLRQTQQKQIDAGMTEISHYQSLYDELQGLVDQNGKVKEGYEQRASFITSTLSKALGVEIKNVDGVIQGYDNLKSTIDEVMEKKKAQILLDSQESLYKEAIQGQTEAIRDMNKAEDELKQRKEERKRLEDELAIATQKYQEVATNPAVPATLLIYHNSEMIAAQERIDKFDEETGNVQKNYDERKDLLSKYAFDIGQYEQNMALAHEGKYNEMSKVNWDYVLDYQKAGDAEKAQLEDQVQITETNLNLLKELKAKSGSDIYDQQITDGEKLLEELRNQLAQYNSTTDSALNETTVIWSDNVDDQLSEITGSKVEFKEDGKGNVTAYIDGVSSGESKSKEEMARLVTETINEISKQETGATKAGEDLIDGVNNGVANERKQSGVFSTIASFGSKLLGRLKASLKESSPSKATKEMGQFLIEGLGIGIEKEEDIAIKQANNFGKSVLNSMNKGLDGNVNTQAFENITGTIPSEYNATVVGKNKSFVDNLQGNNLLDYSNIFNGFMDALSRMKIELDDENVGKFVVKTVTDEIYT